MKQAIAFDKNQEGVFDISYENGKLKKTGKFEKGKLINMKIYNEQGKLIK